MYLRLVPDLAVYMQAVAALGFIVHTRAAAHPAGEVNGAGTTSGDSRNRGKPQFDTMNRWSSTRQASRQQRPPIWSTANASISPERAHRRHPPTWSTASVWPSPERAHQPRLPT